MGVMRFLVHPVELLQNWPEVYRAYICGPDLSVCPTRVDVEGSLIACRRQTSDSGKLYVAWEVPGFGRPVLNTASLPERDEPYLLPVELARGKLVQVRNQLASWEGAGMQIPPGFAEIHAEAHTFFAKAAASQDSPEVACQDAQEAIRKTFQAAEILTQAYSHQSLSNRHRKYTQVPTLLGCQLSNDAAHPDCEPQFLDAFNAAIVPVEWRIVEPAEGTYHWEIYDAQVEWCQENRLVMRGGPLLDLSPDGLPHWLWKWENDIWNLQSFVCDYVETAIRRYAGKIRLWEISARVNSGGALALSEEHRLGVVAKTLDVARHVDEEAELFIRVDQPWAEYQARGQHKLSPIQFADALLRAGVGLNGINLEIAVGYQPRGTSSRDLLDYSRLIDLWSALGLPLHVTLAFPSAAGPDPHCTSDLDVDNASWKFSWSERAQADWVDQYLPLLVAKPAVVGVFWSHFSDSRSHCYPHAGLVRPDGIPKPSLDRIIQHRKNYLK